LSFSLPSHPFFSLSYFSWVENYGSVLRDCAAVISLDPRALKAYYRAGLALLALGRADEALDVCARVGDDAANDAGFKALRERAENKSAELRRKADELAERARLASEEKRKMTVAFTVRVYCTPRSHSRGHSFRHAT
jgi:tetratricopeptide (TPR) repeat protein